MQRKQHASATAAHLLAAVAALAAPVAFGDDDYQFIVAGDPVAAATVHSASDESATTALDGVNRTVAESATTHLYTDKVVGILVEIR